MENALDEIDRDVAVQVMGWGTFQASGETWACTSPFCDHGPTSPCQNTGHGQRDGNRLMYHGRTFAFFAPGWSPTQDWAAAGDVISRLITLGVTVQFTVDHVTQGRFVHLFKGDHAPSHVMSYLTDPRQALCQAAISMFRV